MQRTEYSDGGVEIFHDDESLEVISRGNPPPTETTHQREHWAFKLVTGVIGHAIAAIAFCCALVSSRRSLTRVDMTYYQPSPWTEYDLHLAEGLIARAAAIIEAFIDQQRGQGREPVEIIDQWQRLRETLDLLSEYRRIVRERASRQR